MRDSPLERDGFELAVPVVKEVKPFSGTVMAMTKVRLEAVAFLPGIDGLNPSPCSGESANFRFLRLSGLIFGGLTAADRSARPDQLIRKFQISLVSI